ncbi:MAG: NAD(P)-binding domain-containing protein [Thermodesulfobacteriota bacterium]|nr:NAD(P)-binding domain-containing protein [Thermodesulfobacteriota bacterium]
MKPRIGFVGLGEMGKWMALNVAKAGFPLTVFDIRPDPVKELVESGATAGGNPAEVAKKSEIIMMSLPDTKVVDAVISGEKGLMTGMSPGTILVDLSTIHYLATLRIEEELRGKGIIFIDAPVSGMEARAKEGTLTVMIGGDPAAVEKIRPILDAIGNNIIYMGKSGNGQLTKLVNQLLFNISAAAMAEILPMAVKLGLDPEGVCRVVTTGTGRTFALEFFTPYILENNFKPGYPLMSAYKDMESAVEISSQKSIPLPVFAAAMQTYQLALSQGLGNENKGAMIKVWEKVLGTEVRKRRP